MSELFSLCSHGSLLFHFQWRWGTAGHQPFDKVWGSKWTHPYAWVLRPQGNDVSPSPFKCPRFGGHLFLVPSGRPHVCSHLRAVTFLAVNVNDRAGCHCCLDLSTSDSYFPSMFQACLKPYYAFWSLAVLLVFSFLFRNLNVFFWHEEWRMGG